MTITQAVAPPVIDNITVCEGGNTTISVTSAPGVPTTNTFTWDFESNITNMGVSENSTTVATNAPTQTAGSGLTGVAFQAAGSGCTAAITSSGYDITNTSLADAVADNEYFEFCVGTTLSGVTFNNVSNMIWNHRISSTGPISWAMVAISDLTTPILSGTITGTSCVSAGGAFPSNNISTCYRVY